MGRKQYVKTFNRRAVKSAAAATLTLTASDTVHPNAQGILDTHSKLTVSSVTVSGKGFIVEVTSHGLQDGDLVTFVDGSDELIIVTSVDKVIDDDKFFVKPNVDLSAAAEVFTNVATYSTMVILLTASTDLEIGSPVTVALGSTTLAEGLTNGEGDVDFGGLTLRSNVLFPDDVGPAFDITIAGATAINLAYEVQTTVQYNQ